MSVMKEKCPVMFQKLFDDYILFVRNVVFMFQKYITLIKKYNISATEVIMNI